MHQLSSAYFLRTKLVETVAIDKPNRWVKSAAAVACEPYLYTAEDGGSDFLSVRTSIQKRQTRDMMQNSSFPELPHGIGFQKSPENCDFHAESNGFE